MKLRFEIGGKEVILEAEGAISFEVRDLPVAPPVAVPAPVPVSPEKPSLCVVPPVVPSPEVVSEPVVSSDLFARLVSLRRELAAASGVPPYVVFHDKTLREMAERQPSDLAELGRISGVGQSKLEKYGAAFLAVLQGAAA